MELSMRYIISAAIVVVVLVTLSLFITTGTGPSISQGSANYIFSTKCLEYKQRACSWSVTYDTDYSKYVSACKQIYGPDSDSESCLYVHCSSCKTFEYQQLACDGIARGCASLKSNSALNADRCCSDFAARCPGDGELVSGVC